MLSLSLDATVGSVDFLRSQTDLKSLGDSGADSIGLLDSELAASRRSESEPGSGVKPN